MCDELNGKTNVDIFSIPPRNDEKRERRMSTRKKMHKYRIKVTLNGHNMLDLSIAELLGLCSFNDRHMHLDLVAKT